MKKVQNSGVWEIFVEGTKQYDNYKYRIISNDNRELYKADPYAVYSETNGATASKVYDLKDYDWTDKNYFRKKSLENRIYLFPNWQDSIIILK